MRDFLEGSAFVRFEVKEMRELDFHVEHGSHFLGEFLDAWNE